MDVTDTSLPVSSAGTNSFSQIGYCDHEYERTVHVLVEKSPSIMSKTSQKSSLEKQQTADLVTRFLGGNGEFQETADMFSCGLCGKYLTNILSFLNHKIQHANTGRSVACDLCETKTAYTKQFAFRQHYKTTHKVNLGNARHQKSTRSAAKKKPLSGGDVSAATRGLESPRGPQPKKAVSMLSHNVISQLFDDAGNVEAQAAAVMSNTPAVSTLAHLVVVQGQHETTVENVRMPVNAAMEESSIQTMEIEAGNGSTEISKNTGQLMDIVNTCDGQVPSQSSVVSNTAGIHYHPEDNEDNSVDPLETPETPDRQTTPSTTQTKEISTTAESAPENLDFYFILVNSVRRGNSFNYGKEAFKCVHCDYKTYWKNALLKHMKEDHRDVLSLHTYVEMRSTLENTDQKLIKMSEYVKNQSKLGSKLRSSPKKAIRRPRRPDECGNYACQSCSKVFNKWSYLRKHMRIHVATNNFLCNTCGKAFKTNGSLNQHVKTHQKEEYFCAVCGFKSRVSVAIHAHRQFHNQGSVLCDICGYAYNDRSTLSKHKRVHDPNRAYPCPYPECTWRFKTEMMRNAHFRAHTSEAKFKCSICGYVFRHKHHLRRHERQTHGVQHQGRTRIQKAKLVETEDAVTNISLVVKHELSEEQFQFQTTVDNTPGFLIPITDSEGNTIPIQYEVADIASINVAYQTLLQSGELQRADGRTIYIPQTDCGQIIYQSAANTQQN